ncbi:PRD domain-containing protein [Microbacterium sp. No. 7]|uniref:PRD domain-containing protein n=1 Tax=Microbacterium sp. No. 7 TaxID=1714373 RepID=UPI0006D2C786|nr:PRD domain-containing protein [Microbacterium sp. No. 7]ALJ19445.1 transcription antiterminator BglG [Microbacterium sp. No. 7]
MQIIKKVLNSSVVLVVDERGAERVLLGKGIGFGAKAGEAVPDGVTDRVFVALDDAGQRDFVELMAQIPGEFVELARVIVAAATDAGLALDPHVYLALTDHLHFAVERHRRGMRVVNRLAWELKTVYPTEYAVGLRAVALLRERFGADLPDDEAANVAFHLANAAVDRPSTDTARVVQLISSITTIVANAGGVDLTAGDLHARRFLTHLQFFAERLFSGGTLADRDDFLYRSMSESQPRAVTIAERVRTFIRTEHGLEISNEEVAYLALHIARAMAG